MNHDWEEIEVSIGEVENLLHDNIIEVTSPDGYVPITDFIKKGHWEEYVLYTDVYDDISVNEDHLFETKDGWKFAKEIAGHQHLFLCDKGNYIPGIVRKTGNIIPIVDISIGHKNQRYYSNGISSHNTGKSLTMGSMAAHNLVCGYNVLYITLELAEEVLSQRIDANLLDIPIGDLKKIPKDEYLEKAKKVRKRTLGKLIIKEFPTSSASVIHFKHLLHELKIKKKFIPHIIYIDYINLCASSRVKAGQGANSYTLIKSIAEEIRGLAVEMNIPIVTATQLTRGGLNNSDVGMEDTSECLSLDTKVIKQNGEHVEISTLKPGDKILGSNGFVSIIKTHCPKKKKTFIIKTKSGKIIRCSEDHIFPTNIGRVSINMGLKTGVKLKKI